MNKKKYYRFSVDPEKKGDVIEYLEGFPRILRSEGVTAAIRFLLENMDWYISKNLLKGKDKDKTKLIGLKDGKD
jgi:hypothetical protein